MFRFFKNLFKKKEEESTFGYEIEIELTHWDLLFICLIIVLLFVLF